MHDFVREMRNLGRKQAKIISDQARATAMARKKQYLGARVPKELRDKVIAKADSLGIPVSILIRNILEEAFRKPQSEAAATASEVGKDLRFPGVIGWEDIILNRTMECSSCGRDIKAGSVVMLGLGAPGEEHVIVCDQCRVHA